MALFQLLRAEVAWLRVTMSLAFSRSPTRLSQLIRGERTKLCRDVIRSTSDLPRSPSAIREIFGRMIGNVFGAIFGKTFQKTLEHVAN